MVRNFFTLVIFVVFISCSSDTVSKSDIIDDEKFMEVLKDFHKAEGLIIISRLYDKKNKHDTISLYNYILKKHNISREEFDKTINYYTNHTEEYVPFYDSINNYFLAKKKELEIQLEEDLEKMSPKEQFASKNLWTKKQDWVFSTSKKTDDIKLDFSILTNYKGKYVLSVDVFTSPNLKDIEKRVSLFVNYKDGSKDEATNIKKSIYLKNKKYKHIEVSINTDKNKKVKSISGIVIRFSKDEKRHFHLRNTEIRYIYKKNKKENRQLKIK